MAIGDLIYIDGSGFHYPDFPTVLEAEKEEYRAIYGPDVYLEPDSQDGQLIAVRSKATFDLAALAANVYTSLSPLTALADALSRNVLLNGIERRIPTNSQVDLTITGLNGTVISNGIAQDTNGVNWLLPASVTIVGTEVTATATCEKQGATVAQAGTITKIFTPTRGWAAVTNEAAATPGDPVETDAELRIRQSISTMNPSQSPMEGIVGAVAAVNGVLRFRGYENKTSVTDDDGIPSHSIAIVAEGGVDQEIAEAIAAKKPPGTGTYGTTSKTVIDQYGVSTTYNFFRPTSVTITVEVNYTALAGFLSSTEFEIAKAVADYIKTLAIGDDVYTNRLYTPANLGGVPEGATFVVDSIRISKTGVPGLDTENIELDFNEVATCDPGVDGTPVDVIVSETP